MSATQSTTLLYLLKQVELAVSGTLDDVLGPAGLTSTQYTALTVLEHHPGMTAAALARNSFVRAQTAASLVSALERHGLVERQRDPQSRRQNLIFLTDAGQELLAELRGRVEAIEQQMIAQLSPAQRIEFRHILLQARASLEAAED